VLKQPAGITFKHTSYGQIGGIMSWGFEVGRAYNRRSDIHARFGGQQQGGIITPADHPVVVIITGEEGLQHGYADRYRPDGVFEYFGEGQVGDMQLVRGNRAIAEHSASGKSLLLFRQCQNSEPKKCYSKGALMDSTRRDSTESPSRHWHYLHHLHGSPWVGRD
jgi:hypothetical protein